MKSGAFRDKLISMVKRVNEVSLPTDKPLSKRAIDAKRIIESVDFGCKKSSVAKLVSVLIGEEIGVVEDTAFKPLEMIVPLNCTNSHTYKIGEPALGINFTCPKDMMLMKSGSTGNTMQLSNIRRATAEEIETFFAEVPDSAIEKHLAFLEAL